MSACTTAPTGSELPEATKLLQEGQAALDQGQKEKGITLLTSAARANPGSAEPWVKIAQTHFDAENYPAAIVAADEAQKRDPSRTETKAISVVASLRVAVRALTDMREDSNLRGNTRSEAERLARMLRETLGQDVLVPVPQAEDAKPAVKRPVVSASPATAPAPGTQPQGSRKAQPEKTSTKTGSAPSASGASGNDGNPFSILK